MSPRPFRRLEIEIERARTTSDINGIVSIFWEAFRFENPKLAQVMYAGSNPSPAVEDILRTHLPSEDNMLVIAYDTTKGLVPDPGFDTFETEGSDDDMSYGWISLGVVTPDATLDSYAASDLSVCASLKMLGDEARARGEDPRQLNINDPRALLALELGTRSKEGQIDYTLDPHLVINALVLWPDCHSDSTWEMARKLLRHAVEYAQRCHWQIWTQIPQGQVDFFHEVGFREVTAFTLNLNNYAPFEGRNFGTQEWLQMVYSAPTEIRARSISPGSRDNRRRRRALSEGD